MRRRWAYSRGNGESDSGGRGRGEDPYLASFWDVEQPKLALRAGPDWLAMDEQTGVLFGTPTAAGRAIVAIEATIEKTGTATQQFELAVGSR